MKRIFSNNKGGDTDWEPDKKSKYSSANGTPPPDEKTERVKWSKEDNDKIRQSLIRNGNDYKKIKSLHFASRNEITARNISNHVNGDSELKKIQQANLIQSRETKIQQFRDHNSSERSIVLRDNSDESEEDDNEQDECECCGKLVMTPTILSNGQVLIPNIQYLRESAFFKSNKTDYYFVMRQHLGQYLDCEILREQRLIQWKFTSLETMK